MPVGAVFFFFFTLLTFPARFPLEVPVPPPLLAATSNSIGGAVGAAMCQSLTGLCASPMDGHVGTGLGPTGIAAGVTAGGEYAPAG